jgi:hypothetical protein
MFCQFSIGGKMKMAKLPKVHLHVRFSCMRFLSTLSKEPLLKGKAKYSLPPSTY